MAEIFLSQYLLITFLLLPCHIKQFGVSITQAIENDKTLSCKKKATGKLS